jgi:Lon protease-like protein
MFPLGSVLLPGSVLPLHVFEPRYRALVADVLEADQPEFGVVLIDRGSEVGGGDQRRDAGTVAHVTEVIALPDGRFALTAVGTRRIRVVAWLPDDPYPRAEVEDWPEDEPSLVTAEAVDAVAARVRRLLAMATEAGADAAPATTEISDDPVLATYHLCALAPLGPADRHDLLTTTDPATRLARLDDLLDGAEELLRFRLLPPPAPS